MNQLHKKRSILWLGYIVAIIVALALIIDAISDGMDLYKSPSQFLASRRDQGYIGGVVQPSSLVQIGQDVSFNITDAEVSIPVSYHGALPPIFKEGGDAIIYGQMAGDHFEAQKVLAKHDQYYKVRREE